MNEQEQKQFIQRLIDRLKETNHLKVAYEVAFQFAKDYGVSSMDEVLEAARKSPEVLAESEKRLANLDEHTQPVPEADQAEWARGWLQQWKPSGKTN
jgi:hypothetical protein